MLEKIKQFVLKKLSGKEYLSHIKFRPDIKALAMETYKGVTILYLSKPKLNSDGQPIYHIFHKKKFYFEEADTVEGLELLAHAQIDNNFKNYNQPE